MKSTRVRLLIFAALLALTAGMTACESSGTSTVYVGVHGGYGYGPGWGYGARGYYPGSRSDLTGKK